jgi:hypothetical protein
MNPTLRYSIYRHVPALYIRLEQVQILTRNTKALCRRCRFVTGGRFSMPLLVLLGNVFRGQTGSDTDEAVRKLAFHPYISSLSVDLSRAGPGHRMSSTEYAEHHHHNHTIPVFDAQSLFLLMVYFTDTCGTRIIFKAHLLCRHCVSGQTFREPRRKFAQFRGLVRPNIVLM